MPRRWRAIFTALTVYALTMTAAGLLSMNTRGRLDAAGNIIARTVCR